MSVRVMSAVFDLALPAVLKFVLLVLADHADDGGWNAYPSVKTITRKTSLAERTVQVALKELRRRDLLIKDESPSRLGTTCYRIVIPSLGGAPHAPGGCTSCAGGGAPHAPEPSIEQPSVTNTSTPRRRRGKQGALPGTEDPTTRALIDAFYGEHQRVLGTKYVTHGPRDTQALKRLLKGGYAPDAIGKAIGPYFADPFVLRGVVSIPRFCDRVPTLLAGTSGPGVFPGKQSRPQTAMERAASKTLAPPPWAKGEG